MPAHVAECGPGCNRESFRAGDDLGSHTDCTDARISRISESRVGIPIRVIRDPCDPWCAACASRTAVLTMVPARWPDARGPNSRVDADGVRIEKLVRRARRRLADRRGFAIAGRDRCCCDAAERPTQRSNAPRRRCRARSPRARPVPAQPRGRRPRSSRGAPPVAPAAPAADAPAAAAGRRSRRARASGTRCSARRRPARPTGIALFPPLGTDPIKRGIVVPEGFELPPGYVRHYQTTDDGERCRGDPDVPPRLSARSTRRASRSRCPPTASYRPSWRRRACPSQMLELPEEQGAPDAAP